MTVQAYLLNYLLMNVNVCKRCMSDMICTCICIRVRSVVRIRCLEVNQKTRCMNLFLSFSSRSHESQPNCIYVYIYAYGFRE